MIENEILQNILNFGPVFLLIAARAFAMIQVAPMLSSDAIPQAAKFALAGFTAFAVLPTADVFFALNSPGGVVTLPGGISTDLRFEPFNLRFVLLLIGEATIGLILGFYLTIIFAAFSTAGQFFTLQMGFGASETFDPLSQIENPLMGQFLNLISMLVFIAIGGFRHLFLGGFWRSVQSINIISLIDGIQPVVTMVVSGLSQLFLDAMIISMPILGTLFLTSLTTGLISKAAPQINILSEGFPVSIMVAFMLIYISLPYMIEAFTRVMDIGFSNIRSLFIEIRDPVMEGGNLP